jgi:hypothetical protein
MRNIDNVVPDCRHANCQHLFYTGSCLQECLKQYINELGINSKARWRHRGAYNDFIWAECSNCGFRVENYKAVKTGRSDTDYVDVKYNFCPMCGKAMEV